MLGVEVAATVLSILAAFGSGMDVFKCLRAKQRAKKQDKQGRKLTAEELRLEQSLSHGPEQIRAEYDRSVQRLGDRFKVGDTSAQTSLVHILLVLNTGLANLIHQALPENSKAREMSKRSLLRLSEVAAADTLNILGQLNKRLSSFPRLVTETPPQARMPQRMPHRRKRKAVQQRDLTSCASSLRAAEPKEKKRPGPEPVVRSGWVRFKSGTAATSSGSSTPKPAKPTSNLSSFSLSTDESLNNWPCTYGVHAPPPRYEIDSARHHPDCHVFTQASEPDLLLVSPDVFATDFLPPRPPKIPIERPVSHRKPRPPSVATFLTASTKIGEIPEHKRLDRPALPWENRPLPYVVPPPLEPEPVKRKARGFKSWWRMGSREERLARE